MTKRWQNDDFWELGKISKKQGFAQRGTQTSEQSLIFEKFAIYPLKFVICVRSFPQYLYFNMKREQTDREET